MRAAIPAGAVYGAAAAVEGERQKVMKTDID